MADYRVDPAAVTAAASLIAASADSGPSGVLPAADDCGSAQVETSLSEDAARYRRAWKAAVSASIELASSATSAAETYRETDAAVEQRAR